ncbi:MAG: response regulator transcription factor [Lachnospiraceae bacterium]|jgi:DNA-binding response OmpR family regulator|nr:response regulator transcription factor [Lachnospiraceae bacterium]MEE3437743.1 response regulator transcription factor [Lachnospiraceae bacterium]
MKLLLAEDTRDLNRAVTAILKHEGFEVDSAYDGEEALSFLTAGSYDGIILDIMMPKVSGIEVLTTLRKMNDSTPVLLLTAKAEVDDRVSGLDAGADDYLTKPFAMKELLARIRSMLRRRTRYSAEELHFEGLSLRSESLELAAENSVRLSMKEFELMRLLISNPDKELSTEFILSRLWAGEPDAGADTVYLYISYLRGKLKAVDANVRIEGNRGGSFRLTKA